jgi:NAD(P)-dependent dehydrogenase (short-subunit alcohol dehydrogenase family)
MGKLEGKVAVVTGGNSGIGLATAKRFVQEGAEVFITGRRAPDLEKAATEIGSHVTTFQGDVSVLADLDRLYALVIGIGGTVTRLPLPHHRRCGSAYGGSEG